MSLAFLLDEHLRGPLWWAIIRHNERRPNEIDAVRVGDSDAPPYGAGDPEILAWAEQADRILITLDGHTMPVHLADHLRAGRHSPGVFMIRTSTHLPDIVEFLALASTVSEPSEWRDQIVYIP